MNYIGIDPGLSGAVAMLSSSGSVLALDDTPVASVGKKHVYLPREMKRLIFELAASGEVIAVLEDVHAMPKQGVTSTFSLGRGAGLWEGILVGIGVPYELVKPELWKKIMMSGMGKDKDASRVKALQLFPAAINSLALKKHHGRADALLLAEYRRRIG